MIGNRGPFGRMPHLGFKQLIAWGDHLSVGHREIDAQHKAIFDLGARLLDDWRSGATAHAMLPTVDRLANLVSAHCAYEERLLAGIRYGDLDQHKAEHAELLKEMALMQREFAALASGAISPRDPLLAPGWPVVQFFLEFAVGHVTASDMTYCAAIAGHGPHEGSTAKGSQTLAARSVRGETS